MGLNRSLKFERLSGLMSKDLIPIRKYAYIFDRRHFGVIGTVTLRDMSLEWWMNSKGSLWGRGKLLEGGHKTSRTGLFSGVKGTTGPPAMPVLRVEGLRFPRSVTFLSPPFWKPPLAHALGGISACPTDARFPAPYSCAATSCKIDI